ncbi:uncharacterized protein LOC134332888 [Trichomycterus rosablanca]|uniref:uncharacterized protein LOC134332888 n=1 Tax=Trichomycterus rosablanca TaxID=2290929 RepID=UPI002F357973
MGRRAADLATPVPVSEVPALVGVREWQSGEVGLTCAHHCNVGVQTSPAIQGCQSGKRMTMAPNGYISSDPVGRKGQKRSALFKHRSLESKVKKGVTFQGVDSKIDNDIQTNSNSHSTRKGKRDFRFTNGSVVDSEAIGGISSDISEGEESTPRLKSAVHSMKTLKVHPPCSPPHRFPLRICTKCGGRKNPVAAVLYTSTRDAVSPCSAGSDSLRSSPAMPLDSGKLTIPPISSRNTEKADSEKNLKCGAMQADRRTAETWPRPNLNINATQLLASSQDSEALKLTRHQSARRYPGADLPHTHIDNQVSHASSSYTHTVAVSVIKKTSVYPDSQAPQEPRLIPTPSAHTPKTSSTLLNHSKPSTTVNSQSLLLKGTNQQSTPKTGSQTTNVHLTGISSYAKSHSNSLATPYSPTVSKDQSFEKSKTSQMD